MDVGLGRSTWTLTLHAARVLILVLVDVGLGQRELREALDDLDGLNPCFSGCWSRTLCIRARDRPKALMS